jgi:hypothetical protein
VGTRTLSEADSALLVAPDTSDTIPQLRELPGDHRSVDTMLFLGAGVEPNEPRSMDGGR